MKIGELARRGQCKVETVRYYESEGLLPPAARTTGNYRDYDDRHLVRLRFIRNCRALDMSHQEIHGLLTLVDRPNQDCGDVNRLLDDHIAHVEARIAELGALKDQLVALRRNCATESRIDDCGILQGLSTMDVAERPARHTHLG